MTNADFGIQFYNQTNVFSGLESNYRPFYYQSNADTTKSLKRPFTQDYNLKGKIPRRDYFTLNSDDNLWTSNLLESNVLLNALSAHEYNNCKNEYNNATNNTFSSDETNKEDKMDVKQENYSTSSMRNDYHHNVHTEVIYRDIRNENFSTDNFYRDMGEIDITHDYYTCEEDLLNL